MWYWNKNGDKNQWNSIKIPELNPYIYGQLIFQQGCQGHLIEEKNDFPTNGAGKQVSYM